MASRLTSPLRAVGRFLFRYGLIPVYHGGLIARRHTNKLYLPAKSKILFLFTHRFAIHAAVAAIAVVSASMNLQVQEVRAEGYGEQSVLYALIGGQENIIEEVMAQATLIPKPVSYSGQIVLASAVAKDIDFDFIGEDYVNPSTSILSNSTISRSGENTSTKRNEIETYTVEDGDTIGSIAKRFDLSITTLLWANGLSVRSTIRPGDELIILPLDGIVHVVKKNETLSKIASTYNADMEEIERYNKLASANDLRVGESLLIPGGEKKAPAPTRRVASVKNIFTPAPRQGSSNASAGAGGMIWPTDLRIITQYYGWRHTGVDIDCYYNNNNYATADGIVSFSGWKGGYGYTVDVVHGNGLMTRYAHNARNYVTVGQSVSQGQAVALCGTTGRSTGTHLHFEVISNGRFTNPLQYIK